MKATEKIALSALKSGDMVKVSYVTDSEGKNSAASITLEAE